MIPGFTPEMSARSAHALDTLSLMDAAVRALIVKGIPEATAWRLTVAVYLFASHRRTS